MKEERNIAFEAQMSNYNWRLSHFVEYIHLPTYSHIL